MRTQPDKLVRQVTSKLREDTLWASELLEPEVDYRPVPRPDAYGQSSEPIWRVRLDLAFNPSRQLGLDVNGEVVVGRSEGGDDCLALDAFDAEQLGVSRRHAMLRPTETKLFVVDLGSTNGTRINGRLIGVNTPYSLSNGDALTLGKLEFFVRIIERPAAHADPTPRCQNLIDPLLAAAKAILSQLDVSEILHQTAALAVSLSAADESSIWLVDEHSNELVLEAEHGLDGGQVDYKRMPLNTLAGQVIRTGSAVRANREFDGDRIKVKTGYLVEAGLFVPLKLGGITFGVLAVAHHAHGKRFSAQDQQLLSEIADFTAIAVQNARVYQATDHALLRHRKIVTALNYGLAYDLKHLLNAMIGYAGLLDMCAPLDDERADIAVRLAEAGDSMAGLLDKLIDATRLSDTNIIVHHPCNLVEAVTQAVEDRRQVAEAKLITLDFQVIGAPYYIYGDSAYLYRAVFNLVDNAVRYSPPGARVSVSLGFMPGEVLIRVCDTGPGIPADDLPHLFERYYRSKDASSGTCGLGLGLELVRATVEAHRGRVTARNAEAGGAEFVMSLPETLRVM